MVFLLTCAICVAAETVFMNAMGFSRQREKLIVICTNILTFVAVNVLTWQLPNLLGYHLFGSTIILTALLTIPAVLAEFFIYRMAFKDAPNGSVTLGIVIFSNLISLILSILLRYLIMFLLEAAGVPIGLLM